MIKKISFKMFFSVLGRGLWQAVCWVAGMFGIKDASTYGKVMKRIFIGSLALIALIVAVLMSIEFIDEINYMCRRSHVSDNSCYDLHERQLGVNYTYAYHEYDCKPGFVKDNKTGEKVLEGIIWLTEPQDGDSLVVYKDTKDKRGYFNRYTGKVQITPRFEKAWIFSGGLASVMENGEIFFIDHNGNKTFDKTFPYPLKDGGYCFHGNHCAVENDEGKTGLIDKSGNWVLDPEYDHVESYGNQYWIISKGSSSGVITDSLTYILPKKYTRVKFGGDGFYASKDGIRKLYDLNGNVKVDFIVQNVGRLYYPTDKLDEEGNRVKAEADCLWYDTEYWNNGLMDKNDKPLTKAIYRDIEAISSNRFKCVLSDGEAIILDQYGKEVN